MFHFQLLEFSVSATLNSLSRFKTTRSTGWWLTRNVVMPRLVWTMAGVLSWTSLLKRTSSSCSPTTTSTSRCTPNVPGNGNGQPASRPQDAPLGKRMQRIVIPELLQAFRRGDLVNKITLWCRCWVQCCPRYVRCFQSAPCCLPLVLWRRQGLPDGSPQPCLNLQCWSPYTEASPLPLHASCSHPHCQK